MCNVIGRRLAHYRILELIGSGGMGDVYRARDEQLHRDVAVKVLRDSMLSDPASMRPSRKLRSHGASIYCRAT